MNAQHPAPNTQRSAPRHQHSKAMPVRLRRWAFGVGCCALLLSCATSFAGGPARLDVPLTVWDVAGVARQQDICSTGVPIPCGLMKDAEHLAVVDAAGKAVPAQFRVLERWRDVGEGQGDLSVRWLLVTFLADVPAGGKAVYRLRFGQNPAPAQPVKAAEQPDAWALGPFTLKKDLSAPFQFVLIDPDGKPISASDLPLTWSVWETGPVRASLKVESPTVPGKFGFLAWFYACAGQKRIDMTVVLKNTPNQMIGPLYFKDFSVTWSPAELSGARDFALGGEWGKPVAGRLDANGSAVLYQDSDGTDDWATFGKTGQMSPVLDWTPDKVKTKAARPTFRGYKVTAGERELGAGNFAAGWAALTGQGAAAFAAVRDFYVQYPKAAEVETGKIVLHLWPSHSQAFGGLHWLDDATRKAHDLSFRLDAAPLRTGEYEARSKAFDYPLVAHAPADWGLAAGAYRQEPSATPDKAFAGGVIQAQPGTGRNWVNFGGDVTDQIRRRYHEADLGPFARTGDPHRAYHLLKTARHSSGLTPLWLDDYQYPRDVKALTHAQYCGLARNAGTYRPNTWHHGYCSWNDAHFCCQEVFDAWRLFGDPLALDALTTIGRWCQAYVDFREGGGGLVAGTRADGLPLYNLVEAYRILGDDSMPKSLDRFANLAWKQVNKERGNYGVMDSWEGGKDLCEKPFMMAQVIQGLRAYHELTGDERTADQIYGMADFILDESSIGPWGFKYVVMIDPEKNKADLAAARAKADLDGKNTSYGNLAWVMAWVYRHFGDERFRTVIDGINPKAYPYVPRAYTGYYPERTDKTPPAAVTDLAAEALGGGQVRLTWTAPAGVPVRYQVKWADKPIVERLAYPAEKDAKANWWAATPVLRVPKPGATGAKEACVVESIPAGSRVFAVRSFDAAANRSALSNLAQVVVK
jgi:hypothetical protein